MASSARLAGMDGERLWGGEGRWESGRGMEPDDFLCSRNTRSQKDGKGSLVILLLAKRAQSRTDQAALEKVVRESKECAQ